LPSSLYNLVWSVDDRESRHSIIGYPVFIGRLPYELRSIVEKYDSLGVYIYYPTANKAHSTGVVSPFVSRFHVKLEEDNGRVFLIDHGSEGKGSLNGTYLNGVRLQPGQRVLLRPGDSFQLSRFGPVFTLTVKSVEGETIVLRENVPTLMSKPFASKLVSVEDIQVVPYDKSLALVIPKFHGCVRIEDKGLIVCSEKPSSKERKLEVLYNMKGVIEDALDSLRERRDLATVKAKILSLGYKPYLDLIKEIDSKELQKTYDEILTLGKMLGEVEVDSETLARELRVFKILIEELIKLYRIGLFNDMR